MMTSALVEVEVAKRVGGSSYLSPHGKVIARLTITSVVVSRIDALSDGEPTGDSRESRD